MVVVVRQAEIERERMRGVYTQTILKVVVVGGSVAEGWGGQKEEVAPLCLCLRVERRVHTLTVLRAAGGGRVEA